MKKLLFILLIILPCITYGQRYYEVDYSGNIIQTKPLYYTTVDKHIVTTINTVNNYVDNSCYRNFFSKTVPNEVYDKLLNNLIIIQRYGYREYWKEEHFQTYNR